jgi:hypothetical protein
MGPLPPLKDEFLAKNVFRHGWYYLTFDAMPLVIYMLTFDQTFYLPPLKPEIIAILFIIQGFKTEARKW